MSLSHPLLRHSRSHDDSKVVFVELFFDLVFVFAITQLSHSLLHHFTLTGMVETLFLVLAIWWVWIFTTWVTNWVDPQKNPVRLLLFVLMLAGLVLSMSLPEAFGKLGMVFACAYVFMQVSRSIFMCWALQTEHPGNFRNFLRITAWLSFAGLFWIAGGVATHDQRYLLWGIALLIEYVSPALGFWTPVLGRSTTSDWNISGAHMAERCGLFIIISLGESLLVSGATFTDLTWSALNISGFVTAFVGTVTMWWIYFNIGAERATAQITHASDPGRIARLAYTYIHILIVSGIILVAVSDELILAHPLGHTDGLAAFAIIGGPAIFLLGNLLFKKAVFGKFALSHLVGIVTLGIMALVLFLPFKGQIAPLTLGMAATSILIAVGVWENFAVNHAQSDIC